MKEQLTVKRLVILLIIMTMFLGSTLNMIGYAVDLDTFRDQIVRELESKLPEEVNAELTVEPTSEVGKPFKLNVRLQMPRLLTYQYGPSEAYPPRQMYDEYKNVKVVIPLPDGVTAVDPTYVQGDKLVIDFPAVTENDFQGETDKSKDIMLRVLDNGAVANETEFTFAGAQWFCDVDLYIDEEYTNTENYEVYDDIDPVVHTALASDAWAIQKKFIKTEEIGNQVVFSFDVSVGLEGVDEDGSKFLYSTATEKYDRYGRLNFEEYNVVDFIPELVQLNQDGTQVNTGIYPESVKVIKEAVDAYNISQQTLYDSTVSDSGYVQGETKEISFDARNEYDPNEGTDIIGTSPQYTKYTVKLAYNQDAFLVDSNEKVISTFRLTNNAKLEYKLVGESQAFDYDSANASYVIRKGTGQIVLTKYITYPQDDKTIKTVYDQEAIAKYPVSSAISFTLYKDSECTQTATYLNGDEAKAKLLSNGTAVFDYMEAGTYYIKEEGAIKGFGAVKNPMEVTIPRSGGTVRIGFTNKNTDFGTVSVYKVRETAAGTKEPLGGVIFKLFNTEEDARQNTNSKYSLTTGNDGCGYINDVPVGKYFAREMPKTGYEPNNEIYTVEVTANGFKGFLASDGKYYGTEYNPIVNEMNTGMLYLGVVKWDLDLKDEKEINYLTPSNQIIPVASAYSGYTMKLYYKDADGNIVPYEENGTQVQLKADSNGIVSKALPSGEYYVTALGYDATKYTPWAQGNETIESEYFMGSFLVEKGVDNYNLPVPDAKGNIDWSSYSLSQSYLTEYNVIHNFSGMCNMSLKKLGSGQYVVPEARFDIYKIDKKGGTLKKENLFKTNVATNNKAYAFFGNVEPGWYAFVETATGPRYYLPKNINERRQDMEITAPVFDQSLKGKESLGVQKSKMINASRLVFFNNKLYDETPLVGLTFKKVDANTGAQLYNGAKFNCYYYENNDPTGNRVYLGVFYYKTNVSKNKNYEVYTYTDASGKEHKYNIFPNGFPNSKTYLTQGQDGTKFVPAFADSPTTMVGWIPWELLGKDIDLYVEEIVPPLGYKLPENEEDRIQKITVKGGEISEEVLVIKNQPKPPAVSITVAVSNRNQSQTKNVTDTSTGTFVSGSAVRLYEWDEATKTWKYVAQKNTSVNSAYRTESGATFQTEYGKTYAIAEKKTGNAGKLYFYAVDHKWLKNASPDKLSKGSGTALGTYALKEQTTIDGWTLYGPITMPAATTKAEDYKFTFYNLPLQNVWLQKIDGITGDIITKSGRFSIYRIPEGKNVDSPLSELKFVHRYGSNNGFKNYKGAMLPVGRYVIVEEVAPSGYSNTNERQPFTVNSDIKLIPGIDIQGQIVTMKNYEKEFYKLYGTNYMYKRLIEPAGGVIKDSLLGEKNEVINVRYAIGDLELFSGDEEVLFDEVLLEDSGLNYYAGQNGNGDEIKIEEGDYAISSIEIAKATDYSGNTVKAAVEYRTFGSTEWKKAADVTLSASTTTVNLGSSTQPAASFRVIYDNNSIKNGFYGGKIEVNARLFKRDIFKYLQEIISVKNTSTYSYNFYIYDEYAKREKHTSRETKTAIFNLDPTDLYPRVNIQKSALLGGSTGTGVAREGDVITYTITLTNTGGANPMVDPVIMDKLPTEVSPMETGSIKDYFNISMPAGVKLSSDSGLKTYNKDKYAVLGFKGKLEAGQEITVTFDARVKEDMVSVDNLIHNEAAASSAKKGYGVEGNIDSASFKNNAGEWPRQNTEYSALMGYLDKEAYGYITSKADKTIERNDGITIRKYVQGEADKDTGYRSFISNTIPNGMVNYKIIVQNTGDNTISNLRVADLLPQTGDSVVTTDRVTKWRPIPTGQYKIYKVDQNEKESEASPVIYTATGAVNTALIDNARNFATEGSGWTLGGYGSNTTATAIGFDFGSLTLKKGEYVVIELYMKAPESGDFAGTFASNDAAAYYQIYGTNVDQDKITSNTVHSAYHKKLVGMGGTVFLDKKMDGLRDSDDKLISGIPVKLHVYEDGKYKETLTTKTDADGKYYFDNLMPSYVEKGKVKEGSVLYQYQVEFVVPEGTCITNQYAGGADAWKNNIAGKPGDTPAPETTGDSAYSDKKRENDSNADVITHKSEIFYLNPCDNTSADSRTREAGYDLTYDAGLVRVRTIELHKMGGTTFGNPLEGAVFKLTGTGLPADGITATSDANGVIRFENPIESEGAYYRINYYGNYKVEEVSSPEGYINQGWFETIIAGTDEDNLTYDALNEECRETYTVFNPKHTSLTITKKVQDGVSADTTREFKFSAIIDGHVFGGEYTVTMPDSTTIKRNTANYGGYIMLRHNESAVIDDLVDGVLYSVREEPSEGFTSVGSNTFGILSSDETKNVASFINEKEKGYIRISKVYEGNTLHRNDDFTFTVKINGVPYNGYYNIDGVSYTAADGKVVLKGGQTAVIQGGIGQTFEVVESPDIIYQTEVTASSGITVKKESLKATGQFTKNIGEITYTNTMQTSGLYVSKELDAEDFLKDIYADSNFIFKIETKNAEEKYIPYQGEYTYYPDKKNNKVSQIKYTSDGTFMNSPSSTVYFDLPKGEEVRVTELFTGNEKYEYDVKAQVLKGTAWKSYQLGSDLEVSGYVGIDIDEIKFVNSFKNTGSINITKTVQGKSGDTTEFVFNLYIDGKLVKPVSYKMDVSGGTYTPKSDTDGNIKIKHGHSALIENIPAGARYEVIEKENANYTTVKPDNYSGVVTDTTKPIEVNYKNVYKEEFNDGRKYLIVEKKVESDDPDDYEKEYTLYLASLSSSDANGKNGLFINYKQRAVDWNPQKTIYIRDMTKPLGDDNPYLCPSEKLTQINSAEPPFKSLPSYDIVKLKPTEQLYILGEGLKRQSKYDNGVDYYFRTLLIDEDTPTDMKVSYKTDDGDIMSIKEHFTYKEGLLYKNMYRFGNKTSTPYIWHHNVGMARTGELKDYYRDPLWNGGSIITVTNTRKTSKFSLTIKKELSQYTSNIDYVKENNKNFPIFIEVKEDGQWYPYSGEITSSLKSRGTFSTSNGMADISADETLTIKDIVSGTQFRVREIDVSGLFTPFYKYLGKSYRDRAEVTVNNNITVTITNRHKPSVINIEKINNGGNPDDEFTFNVIINDKPFTGEYTLYEGSAATTGQKITNGVLKLKGGQSARISGINPDSTYCIEEVENPDYMCGSPRQTGTIGKGKATVKFTNTIKQTGLTITKTAVGAEPDHVFRIKAMVKLPGSDEFTPYNGSYYIIDSSGGIGENLYPEDGVMQLKADQSIVMKDIPVGSEYKLEELEHSQYKLTESSGTTGIITETGNIASFTNTRKTNSLVIAKTQIGGSAEDEFNFIVSIDGKAYAGKAAIKDSSDTVVETRTIADGRLVLKGGQSAVIDGIPLGTEYEITEEDRIDYEETLLRASGVIEEGTNREVFMNTKLMANLILSKENVGGATDDQFTFNLEVDGTAYIGNYTLISGEEESSVSTADGTIILKGGQTARVSLPVGSSYTVTESNADGYTKQIPLVYSGEDDAAITTEEGSAAGTVVSGIQKVEFTNVYTPDDKASLEINKVREGGNPSDEFTFNVTIDGEPYKGSYTLYDEEGTLKGSFETKDGRITIQGGGRIYITGLEPDAAYAVTEEPAEGYTASTLKETGNLSIGEPSEGHISVNAVRFVNTYMTGGFAVIKNNIGGSTADEFTFTAERETSEDKEVYEAMSFTGYKLYKENAGGDWDLITDEEGNEILYTDINGQFKLFGGQKAVFEGIDSGTEIEISEDPMKGYTTSVTVEENGVPVEKNTAEIVIQIPQETITEITYNNDYFFKPAEAVVKIKKILETSGERTLRAREFTFRLTSEDGKMVTNMTATNDKDGNVIFDPIQFDENSVGETYIFKIEEEQGVNPSIKYSDEVIYAKVAVSLNGDNKIIADVSYSRSTEPDAVWTAYEADESVVTISNIYVVPTHEQFKINKLMTGDGWEIGAPLIAGQYNFNLYEVNGDDRTLIAKASNGISPAGSTGEAPAVNEVLFPNVTFFKAGVYEYEISEIPGTLTVPGITYSNETIKVTVVVKEVVTEDGATHSLVSAVSYFDASGKETGNPAITNRYTKPNDITTTLEADKVLTGGRTEPLREGEFNFGVYKNGELIKEASNKSFSDGGQITFEGIPITLGENIFEIREIIPEEDKRDVSIIRYDDTVYTAVVIGGLSTDKNSIVVVSTTYYKNYNTSVQSVVEKPVFNNEYQRPSEVKKRISLTKKFKAETIDGNWSPKKFGDHEFEFAIEAITEGAPLPADKTVRTTGKAVSEETVSFGDITFTEDVGDEPKTYVYKIKEVVPADADPRVVYDDREIYVEITVSKDGNNNLTASEPKFYDAHGSELGDGAVFNNKYSMWTGGFAVIKQNIDGYSDDEFTFTVTADGVPLSNVSYKLYNKAVGDNLWTEVEGTGVSTDAGGKFKLKGDQKAVFDNLAVDTKIVVTEDGVPGYSTAVDTAEGITENTSEGQVTIAHEEVKEVKFINDYALFSEEVQISFEKQLIGSQGRKNLKDGELRFELTADKEIPGVSLPLTATNDKDGKVTFDPIRFGEESVGQTYIFTAREIAGNDPSIIYTDDKIYAKVEVSRDANRQVVTNVTYSQNPENDDWEPASERTPTLINTYIEPTGVRFRINKKVEGSGWEIGAPLEKGQYSFLLFETTNGEEEFVAEVKNGILPAGTPYMEISPEDVIFPYVEFKEAKQYTYKIVELPGSKPGISYSTQAIYITVNVSNNNNNLVAMVQYTGEDGEPLSEPTITNRYNKPNDITTSLEAVKTLEGDRAKRLEAGEFEFGLYQNDVLLREAYNSTDGNIRFDDVTVTLGDNIFEIKEIVPDEGHRDISITSYDNSIYTAVVNVGLNDDKSAMVVNRTEYFTNYGQSNQKKLSEEEVPVFVNTYTKPDEAVQTIGLTKKLVDKAGTPVNFGEDSFRFILSAVDKDAPMPTTDKEAVLSGKDISEGSASFGQITFSEDVPDEGKKYVYKISEIIPENKAAGKNPSIEYDSRDIFARIIVTKKSDKNELVASEPEYFTVDSEGNETVLSEALFENVYSTPEEASAIFTVTKKYIGKELKEGDFEFTLTPVDGAPGKQETVTNDADGKVEFSAISFAEDPGNGVKTYSYRISEVNKGYPSITYDDKDILVTVNVSKGEDNHLVSEVIYQKTGEAKPTSDPTFTNVYKVPEPADIQFSVKKEYKNGPKLKGGEFTFILMDKEGNGIDSAENDANGNVRFKDIKISSDLDEATYEYSIAEKSGNKTGVIYDKKIVDVKVKVIKGTEGEDKNKLLADVKYYIDGEETTAPTFNNIYSPPLVGTTVSITAKKEYKNGVLNGNDFKFRLEPTSDNPLKTTMYAFNDKNGNVYFAPLEFFSVGEYHYTLTEVAGDNKNVVYDTDKVDVTVKVTTTRYGTLTADVEYEKRGEKSNTFVNEYKDPDSTVANIFARKILKGRDLEGNEFEFLIQPTGNTKGESYSVRNSGDGTVSFKEMTFTEEGTYTYRIIELHSSTLKYITYDNVPINVTVTVTRNSDGRLMSYVSYKKDSEVSNTFINTYDRESEGLPPEKDDNKESEGLPPERNNGANNPKTGDQADFMGNLIVMLLSSLGLVVFFSTGKKKDKKRLNGTIR